MPSVLDVVRTFIHYKTSVLQVLDVDLVGSTELSVSIRAVKDSVHPWRLCCRAKPKGSNYSLVKSTVTVFWLFRAAIPVTYLMSSFSPSRLACLTMKAGLPRDGSQRQITFFLHEYK